MKTYLTILATIMVLCLWLIAGALLSMVGLQREELRTQLNNDSSNTLVVPNNQYHDDGPSIQIVPVPDNTPSPEATPDSDNNPFPNKPDRS